jgi:hypothetical protein
MSLFSRTLPRPWVLILVLACLYLAWTDVGRIRHVDYVSALEGRARAVDAYDARSPTGYADAQRELIVPERSEDSLDWIAETQQMLASGELRIRHLDTENAPWGRDVGSPSPYRWWLGLVAWADHAASGRPIGLSVEHAALLSDPVLQLAFLVAATLLVARRFGGAAAAVAALGLATFYPLASGFLAGMPDQRGVSCLCALSSVLLLLAGMRDPLRTRAWFALAGCAGGVGMWLSVPLQAPIMLGIAMGAVAQACVFRGSMPDSYPPPWRAWGFSAGVTVLLAYLGEHFPSDMGSMAVQSVQPAYGLALVSLGEALRLVVPLAMGQKRAWDVQRWGVAAVSMAATAALAVPLWRAGGKGFFSSDLLWPSLSRLPGSPVAASTLAWLGRDGMSVAAWATLLPMAATVPALWLVLRRHSEPLTRALVAFALCPVVLAAGFAMARLGWWGECGAAVIVLMVAIVSGTGDDARIPRWLTFAIALAACMAGVAMLRAPSSSSALTPREGEELIDRHLAHWLAERSGHKRAIVFAPPNETLGLWFYGDLRGIGTFSPDNRTGFGATLNIAAASTMEEVENDIRALGISYVVVPSWDPFFDDFGRLYLDRRFANRTSQFISGLRGFNLPPWLRAVPYQIPVGGGFAGQSVLVFEVVEDQAPAAAAGRLAEYLVETGDLDRAASVAQGLRRFPGDVGALAAEAQVEGARGDTEGVSSTLATLLARLHGGGDRYLPWDRRVSLSIVLAQAGRNDLSRVQVARCIADLNEARLRFLSTGSLYALLVLSRGFGVEITDPRLRDLAPQLLPADIRGRL